MNYHKVTEKSFKSLIIMLFDLKIVKRFKLKICQMPEC